MRVRAIDPALLRAHMNHRKLSQAGLAREAFVSRQMISMLASGARGGCTERVAQSIEKALRVRRGTLFAYGPEPRSAA
ncbi:helix-turn-helix domain-containing protein [Segniliparus rotundus]|uniref:helix-turn-helix domain-containing protein n=1 Tax=Segniliparus rotundus TaxID=286802 RepID=UPI00059BE060|nr:helix-turn-helix transcriptional regulator [Segniliparus rotundus]